MAYAAVLSLENTINGLLSDSSPPETLRSALDHAKSLRDTLKKCSEGVGDMDEQMMIIEAAIKLQDAIEFSLLSHQPPTFSLDLNHDIHCFVQTAKEREQIIEGLWEQKAAKQIEEDSEEEEEEDAIAFSLLSHQPPTFSSNLDDDVHCFVQTAKEREQTIQGSWEQKAAKEIEEAIEELFLQKPDQEEEEEEDVEMVGLRDQFLQIRHNVLKAYEVESYNFSDRVMWISGMAGVCKTALAKKVFHDPLIKTKFQSRALIRVGLTDFWSAERIVQANCPSY